MPQSPASFALGPALMGVIINVFLFGVMATQCFIYYSRYPNDKMWLKLLVGILLILDILNVVFDVCWAYDATINKFGDFESLNSTTWLLIPDPITIGAVSSLVQLFYAWRVKIVIGNKWLVGFLVLTGSLSVLAGTGTTVAVYYIRNYADFPKFQAAVIVWLVGASVCDITITIAMTYHLRRNRTGFAETDDVLNKITRLTMQNGLVTSIWATTDLLIYLIVPSGLHLAFNLPLAKLYTNSMMTTLNAREPHTRTRRHASNDRAASSENSRMKLDACMTSRKRDMVNLTPSPRPEVFVTVEEHEMADVQKGNLELDWKVGERTTVVECDAV